jgi:hypothetical protein
MRWLPGATQGEIVAGGHGGGNGLHQLRHPWGIAVDGEGAVLVADTGNHRVMRWLPGATQGEIVAGGNGAGSGMHQFNICTTLALEVMSSWSPTMNSTWSDDHRAFVKLMLMVDVRRSRCGLAALGSTLITRILPWALPVKRSGLRVAKQAQHHTPQVAEMDPPLPVIQVLEHGEPPAIIDDEMAASVVAELEAGYIERGLGTNAGDLESTSPSGPEHDVTDPESSFGTFSPLVLLNFTRHPSAFEEALARSELLREVREQLDRAGTSWKLPHGVKLFVHPFEVQAAMHSIVGLTLGASHVIVSETLAPLVLAEVNGLPRRYNVQLKNVHVLAYTMGGEMQGTMIVRNTFLHGPSQFTPPQQAVQSTTVAHRGRNPRQRIESMVQ